MEKNELIIKNEQIDNIDIQTFKYTTRQLSNEIAALENMVIYKYHLTNYKLFLKAWNDVNKRFMYLKSLLITAEEPEIGTSEE